ncbi:MAG: hypothetical protein HW394_517, partial [Acidobacteria bacterium]|nr:hypothetical protein [Acidobacteriota bacterium]
MLDLGTSLPPFRLPDLHGATISSGDFAGSRGLLV